MEVRGVRLCKRPGMALATGLHGTEPQGPHTLMGITVHSHQLRPRPGSAAPPPEAVRRSHGRRASEMGGTGAAFCGRQLPQSPMLNWKLEEGNLEMSDLP